MGAFDSLRSALRKPVQMYGNYLAREGYKLIMAAYNNRDFTNRTYNLHDSYGSCVFFKGKEIPNTRRYVGRSATVWKKNRQGELILGRAEIDRYFDTYQSTFDGFEVVMAVAIFYGEILEKGKGKLRRKYKVISGMDSELALSAKKLNATVVNINI